MIEIRKVGLIDIDIKDLIDVKQTKWAILTIERGRLKIQMKDSKTKGAVRIRYYNGMAQIEAEEFIHDHLNGGIYKTNTKGNTISINLQKDLSNDY